MLGKTRPGVEDHDIPRAGDAVPWQRQPRRRGGPNTTFVALFPAPCRPNLEGISRMPRAGESGMKRIQPILKALWQDESGQDMIEYALIATLISLVAIASVSSLGNIISNYYNNIGNSL